jgi:hypothetical protein
VLFAKGKDSLDVAFRSMVGEENGGGLMPVFNYCFPLETVSMNIERYMNEMSGMLPPCLPAFLYCPNRALCR